MWTESGMMHLWTLIFPLDPRNTSFIVFYEMVNLIARIHHSSEFLLIHHCNLAMMNEEEEATELLEDEGKIHEYD